MGEPIPRPSLSPHLFHFTSQQSVFCLSLLCQRDMSIGSPNLLHLMTSSHLGTKTGFLILKVRGQDRRAGKWLVVTSGGFTG